MTPGEAATDRSWTNPAWGQSLHIVFTCWASLLEDERLNHLGFMIVFWTALCLIIAVIDPVADFAFGLSSYERSIGAFLSDAPRNIAICLLAGTALALLLKAAQRFGLHRHAYIAERAQAEVFTNGVYPAGHAFINGAHPFFAWPLLTHVDFKGGRWLLKFMIAARGHDRTLILKLTPSQAAMALDAMHPSESARGSLLFAALGKALEAHHKGRTIRGSVRDAPTPAD